MQNSLNHISLIRWAVIPKRIAGIHDKFIDSVCEINEDSAVIRNHGARVRGHIAWFCQGDGIHILAVIGVHNKVIPYADILQQRKHAVIMRAKQMPSGHADLVRTRILIYPAALIQKTLVIAPDKRSVQTNRVTGNRAVGLTPCCRGNITPDDVAAAGSGVGAASVRESEPGEGSGCGVGDGSGNAAGSGLGSGTPDKSGICCSSSAVSCVADSEVLREDSDCADSAGRGSACHEQAATLVSTANVATSISALVRRI